MLCAVDRIGFGSGATKSRGGLLDQNPGHEPLYENRIPFDEGVASVVGKTNDG